MGQEQELWIDVSEGLVEEQAEGMEILSLFFDICLFRAFETSKQRCWIEGWIMNPKLRREIWVGVI